MGSVIHGFENESMEAKTRWFKSLKMEERARIFCEYYRLVKTLNPKIAEVNHARSDQAGIRILRKT